MALSENPEFNSFVEIPEHINKTLKLSGKNNEQIKKITNKFKQQYPDIDEKSYKLLQRENKAIGRNYTEDYKRQSELSELINYSLFKSILKDISKENSDILDIKIYNTYPYTDRKTGVDYTIFIKLKNGGDIAFGIDLKNGRNAEENHNGNKEQDDFSKIGAGIFTLVTQNTKGETQDYSGIKKNINISKNLYNNISKHKRKYTLGINSRNQLAINNIVISEILTTKLNNKLKERNSYNVFKKYLESIVDNEIDYYNTGILFTIEHTRTSADELLDKTKALKVEKERKKEYKKKI